MKRRNLYTSILAAGLWAGVLAAQSNPETGTLRGTVRDAATAAPLGGISVEVFSDQSPDRITWFFTDLNGTFEGDLLPGRYYLLARGDDSFRPAGNQLYQGLPCFPGDCDVRQGRPIDLAAGEEIEGLLFELPPAGFIEGTARRASDGSPVAEGVIAIWNESGYLARTFEFRDGRFRSLGLADGTYFVSIADGVAEVGQLHGGGACQLPPGSSRPGCDVKLGRPVVVRAGASVGGIDFLVEAGAFLRGRVVGSGGQPPAGAVVEALDGEKFPVRAAELDEEGRYLLGPLALGRYHLEARAASHPWQLFRDVLCFRFNCDLSRSVVVEVHGAETLSGLDFRLHDFGELAGRVENERTGVPLRNAQVALYLADGRYYDRQFVDPDGGFRFERLAPGRYLVGAFADAFESRLYGGAPLPDPLGGAAPEGATHVLVPEGGSLDGVRLRLPEQGRLEGRVVDAESGAPLPEVYVLAYRAGEERAAGGATADADGNFRVAVPAGTWYLVAVGGPARSRLVGTSDGCPIDLSNRATCDPSRGQAFVVETGRRVAVGTIGIGSPARLRGGITLAEPGAGVYLELHSREGKLVRWDLLPYDNGAEFDLEVPAGRYYLEASAQDHANQLYGGVDCPAGPDEVFVYSCPDPRLGTPIDVAAGEERGGLDLQLQPDRSPCQSSFLRLCLGGGRFSLTATLGGSQPYPISYVQQLTRDAGIVPTSPRSAPELIKVLDACEPYGNFWLFTSRGGDLRVRDRFAGVSRLFQGPVADLGAFANCDVPSPERPATRPAAPPAKPVAVQEEESPCGIAAGEPALCLLERFKVTAEWQTTLGEAGPAAPLAVDEGTGALSFFGADNLELVVRLVDDCRNDRVPRFWVYASGATDVGFRLRVLDTRGGVEKVYDHPAGQPFLRIEDRDAFATCLD